MFEDDGKIINELNGYLVKHEEYYMKKSTLTKLGGTIYGELFNLRYIVYDYYLFYKKNYIMLDWFNNAEKICEPYVKAILCTYYPDEYQYTENRVFGRTHVEPYPLTLIDIDIIVKHTNYNNFKNWISYYKVFSLKLDKGIDIVDLFENFCMSMKNFWNRNLNEKLKVFSILISLVKLTSDQKNCILKAFINLVTPDVESEGAVMLRNCLNAIWIFVNKQYEDNENYTKLLRLLINEDLVKNLLDGKSAYEKLIDKLWCYADEEIYNRCNNMIVNQGNDIQENGRIKSYLVFEYHKILIKFDKSYWRKWIIDNLNNNWIEEVYEYVLRDTIEYNAKVSNYYRDKLEKLYADDNAKGVYSYPDNKTNAINSIIIFLLSGRISEMEDIKFLEKYTKYSDYLYFLFYPDLFDYSKITTADYMWCNFINNNKYRDLNLKHKSEFWTEDDVKRISLGFGSNFENRCAYKYLFD